MDANAAADALTMMLIIPSSRNQVHDVNKLQKTWQHQMSSSTNSSHQHEEAPAVDPSNAAKYSR
jgi:hypothetical protein